MHISSFMMPTIRQEWHLIFYFSIDFKDAYLHIPIVKHHYHFYGLFDDINLFSERFCHWDLHLLNPHCSFGVQGFSC